MIAMRGKVASLAALVVLAGSPTVASGTVAGQQTPSPFFDHPEELSAVYGAELIAIRMQALLAFDDPPDELLEKAAKARSRDLPRFAASLAAADAELAADLGSALDDVLRWERTDGVRSLAAAAERTQQLSLAARSTLVPPDLLADPAFLAALATKLLLAEDGVAEAYEDAADGDRWEYPTGWAALARVRGIWGAIRDDFTDEAVFEVGDMLETLDALYPAPEPPRDFRGDPEEAEAPAQRIVGFLESGTGVGLYPDRDIRELFGLTQRLVGRGCAAYAAGSPGLGRERVLAGSFYYREYLRRLLDLFAPNLNRAAATHFERLLDGDPDAAVATLECGALFEIIGEVHSALAA